MQEKPRLRGRWPQPGSQPDVDALGTAAARLRALARPFEAAEPAADAIAAAGGEDCTAARDEADREPAGGGDRPPLGAPDQASAAPERIREATIRVLRERIALVGIDRSGAYDHYNLQLSRGFPIPSYEVALLDLVRQRLPDLRSYHEIGSGLGTLPFMLAHDGFAAVGVERDERRHLTATAILRELADRVPHIESNCRLIWAAFPDAVADIDVSESMAIFTDFVSTQAAEELSRIYEALGRYRYVLLDLQRFCRKRETSAEQQELIRELARYGLSPRAETIDLGSDGYYRLFDSLRATELRNAMLQRINRVPTLLPPEKAARAEVAESPARQLPAEVPAAEPPAIVPPPVLPPRPQRVQRRRFGGALGISALLMIGLPTLISGLYYGYWASRQYLTTFQFAVRGAQSAEHLGTASYAGLGSGSVMTPDAYVVTEFINSPQAVEEVDKDINLRAIFSYPTVDFWSRLDSNVTMEELDVYWKDRVSAHFDLMSGIISVTVRAFKPEDSLKVAQAIIDHSDRMFTKLNVAAQSDFVRLADENLARAEQRLGEARAKLQAFRGTSGLLDPGKVAAANSGIVDKMREDLGALKTQYASMQALSPNAPGLPVLRSRIKVLEDQIRRAERAVEASPVVTPPTPETLGRYETLNLELQFAEKLYTSALEMHEKAYTAAHDRQSYLALFVKPTLAQTSVYPDRPRAIAEIVLAAAVAWFFAVMITYAIRDHLM